MVNLKVCLIDPKAWALFITPPVSQFDFSTSSGYQTLIYIGVTLAAWLKRKRKIFGYHQKYLDTFIMSVVGPRNLHFSKASLVLLMQCFLYIIL